MISSVNLPARRTCFRSFFTGSGSAFRLPAAHPQGFLATFDGLFFHRTEGFRVPSALHRESLRLYKEGKTIEDIAKERSMAVSTIEGHLASFIPSGEVKIDDFLNENELTEIKKVMDKFDNLQLSPLKSELADKFTYGQLRMAMSYFGDK